MEKKYVETTIQTPDPQDHKEADTIKTMVPLAGLSDDEFRDLAGSVLVVIPHRLNEGIESGICTHFGMWGRIGLRVATIKDPQGGFIEVTRGGLVQMFLEFAYKNPKIKYLVMIDNDQSILWDHPLTLARHGLPVVSGVVCSYSSQRGIFACFTANDQNGIARFPSVKDTKTIPATGLLKAEQVGTGLVCIRRDVLEKIKEMGEEPFFIPEDIRRESVAKGQLKKSEDICFSERCKKYGFDRWVDLSVHATHYKRIGIGWPGDCVDEDMDAVDWKPSAFDYKGVI